MPLTLNFGPAGSLEVDATGDLARYLQPGVQSIIRFAPEVIAALDRQVSEAPDGSLSTGFHFASTPNWKIMQSVGITLSVKPEATCTLAILKPGDKLFEYAAGDGGDDAGAVVKTDGYCASVAFECSLAVDAGAEWSSGNLGVSGSVGTSATFRVANYCRIDGSVPLREAIRQAFSTFVLPFHSASVKAMPGGNYLDFEFAGKLALGFGATYGFSGLLFGGLSAGEVKASASTPIASAVVSATPSFQVGAGFKIRYTHSDHFRVVAGRVRDAAADGATLYLFRGAESVLGATENFGIEVDAGAKFEASAAGLKAEIEQASRRFLGGDAGNALAERLGGASDALVKDVNGAVNGLLAKAGALKTELELEQSRQASDTALFIYRFDFTKAGIEGYQSVMRGDYAAAIALPGVEVAPDSFVERLYTRRAGISLHLFGVLAAQDLTEYVRKSELVYVGSRVFQLRDTRGVRSVSSLFGHRREADLYFIAECRTAAPGRAVSGVSVRLHTVLTDTDNADAFR